RTPPASAPARGAPASALRAARRVTAAAAPLPTEATCTRSRRAVRRAGGFPDRGAPAAICCSGRRSVLPCRAPVPLPLLERQAAVLSRAFALSATPFRTPASTPSTCEHVPQGGRPERETASDDDIACRFAWRFRSLQQLP